MKNLSNLAVESDECRALLQKSMIGPFLDRIERRPMGIVFETRPWKEQPLFFWKFVLREALHSARFGMFSDKSVISFLERVQANKLRSGWLQCRRDYAVYLQEDGRVYVLYPSSFPFAKQNMYDIILGQGKATTFAFFGRIQSKRYSCLFPKWFNTGKNDESDHGLSWHRSSATRQTVLKRLVLSKKRYHQWSI